MIEGNPQSLTYRIEQALRSRHPVTLPPERARNYAEIAAYTVNQRPRPMPVDDVRIARVEALPSPQSLKCVLANDAQDAIRHHREQIADILHGRDPRLLCIVGPCSIHDLAAGMEYAERLLTIKNDRLLIVMRAYFEKPRTALGWKGFVADPHLDGSDDIVTGLTEARRFLVGLAHLGLPVATEFVDPLAAQYLADLVSWAAVGARTIESPTHRHMGSGLSMPVGFKNRLDGDIEAALNAIEVARQPHTFLGIDQGGCAASFRTTGNPDAHLVLRGGVSGPNYQEVAHLRERVPVVVDCSHGNSARQPRLQRAAWDTAAPIANGVMLESFLVEGAQAMPVVYGQSITDACLGWEDTRELLESYHA